MICDIEKAKALDFLKSFNLEMDEIEDTNSLAYRITDTYYINTVNSYLNEIKLYKSEIDKYISPEYNLFLNLYFYLDDKKQINNIYDYFKELESITKYEFKKLVFSNFNIGFNDYNNQDDYSIVESINTDSRGKWNLLSMIQSTSKTLIDIRKLLEKLYPIFNRYEDVLIERSKDKMQSIIKMIKEQPKRFYRDMLDEYVSSKLIDSIDFEDTEHYVIYMNAHLFISEVFGNKRILATGIYLPEYFKYKNINDLFNNERRQQVMKSLADPSRFKILTLIHSGVNSNKKIAEVLGITPAGVSYQTNQLTSVELLKHQSSDIETKLIVNTKLIEDVFNYILSDFGIYRI